MITANLYYKGKVSDIISSILPKVCSSTLVVRDYTDSIVFRVTKLIVGREVELELSPLSEFADDIICSDQQNLKEGYSLEFNNDSILLVCNNVIH